MDSAPRICLISPDREAGDSPDLRLGKLLASVGWDVHILTCEPDFRPIPAGERITVSRLADFPETPEAGIPEWAGNFDRRSLHVLAALESLHAAKPFDIIQYPEEGAPGYRVAQARRTGVSLEGAFLLARLRGPSAWRRTTEARWLSGPPDVVGDFAEQTSVELADGRVSPSRYLIDEAQRLGWAVPRETPIIPEWPDAVQFAPRPSASVGEVVFVGPLDKLHGLRVFVRAVQSLPASVPVAFVGSDSTIQGQDASEWAIGRLKGRRATFHEARDWSAILAFLRERNRLAVLPYLSATDIDFVRTLARNGIPFLVTDYGPASELVSDDEVRKHVLFPASVSGLACALKEYIAESAERRCAWVDRLAAIHAPAAVREHIISFYSGILQEARARRVASAIPTAPQSLPKVTVGITHFNLGQFLPATLASIAAQTYPNLEVVVADDGSNDPASVAAVEEMERKYPTFKFLRGPNVGVCGNRNRCLDAATGELFFPLDADNIAAPNMIEQLVATLNRQPADVSAVSCFWLGFTNDENLKAGRYCGIYRPTGGPRTVVGLWNPYGETSGLFRTAQLRELGGYDDLHPEYMSEDWHLYIKLVARGWKVAVIPKALYFYRIRGDSRYRTGDHGVNHVRVLPDVAAMPFTAAERLEVWTLLASMHHGMEAVAEYIHALEKERQALHDRLNARRYRVVDEVCLFLKRITSPQRVVGGIFRKSRRVWERLTRPLSVAARR